MLNLSFYIESKKFSTSELYTMSMKSRVLVIAAHPDDVEILAGGTLLKHAMRGDKITEAIMTRGELGWIYSPVDSIIYGFRHGKRLAEIREEEARKAASLLGVKEVVFCGLPDRRVKDMAFAKVQEVVEQTDPEVIYAPEPDYSFYHHPDHLSTGEAVKSAALSIPVRFYHTTMPNLSVDVRDVYSRKMDAIRQHSSQRCVLFLARVYLRMLGMLMEERFREWK